MSTSIGALVTLCLMASTPVAVTQEMTLVRPVDSQVPLRNLGMGWVFHHYDNSIEGYGPPLGPAYDGSEFPGMAVAYLRLAWEYLEPAEGQFNWSVIDTPAQRYIAAGMRIAFRFTCYEGDTMHPYATPRWIREAGAKGYDVDHCWEPDYDDPIYLEKLEHFLAAAGARYDGDPNVAFVDVGTLGIWGEGHPIARNYSTATAKHHIDLHKKFFPKTLLAIGDDFAIWYGDYDLTSPRRVAVPVAFEIAEDNWGLSFAVYAGLWIPGDASRPNARLLPSNGEPDRRVPLGELAIAADGTTTFTPGIPPTQPGGDFEIAEVTLEPAGPRNTLSIVWDVRTENRGNVQPFCHLDRNGAIAIGGGRSHRNTAPIDYARSLGLTLRDDSILVEPAPRAYHSHAMAQPFWPARPVILESGHYGYAKQINAWGDGSGYFHALEDYHASYVSIHANPIEFLAENTQLIHDMNMRLGYRLNLVEAKWPVAVSRTGRLNLAATWSNVGVAPCLPGGFPTWWLCGEKGSVVATLVDDGLDVRELPVGQGGPPDSVAREREFRLPPHLTSGEYEVRVSVGSVTGTPRIALPLEENDGHLRYRLGHIRVE